MQTPAKGSAEKTFTTGGTEGHGVGRGDHVTSLRSNFRFARGCYDWRMFNFGKPKTIGDWIVHIAGAIVAIFLVWWMLRMYVL